MQQALSSAAETSILSRGFSRRQLGRIASVLTAGAALPFYNEAAYAQRAIRADLSPDTVRINSNENPLGPCPEALEAISAIARLGGRYAPNDVQGELTRTIAEQAGLKPDHVSIFAGSSDPLMRVVLAYVSPKRPFVMTNPGYESGASTAAFIGAKAIHVPLRPDYSHDVPAMVKADANAGLIYICNPNNPTGTLTKREDIEWALANMPKGCTLLVDEAYIHFSSATTCLDLVAAGKNIIVLRTFSKVYGMAGIRSGYAAGRPDLIDKLKPYGPGFVPITGVAAATASLRSKTVVPQRKKINADIRDDVFAFLDKKNIAFVRSEANHFMIETHRPTQQVIDAMAAQNVLIGRAWPIWPTHVRVSVGTREEMSKFKVAFAKVMA